jgi:hypothetical protein
VAHNGGSEISSSREAAVTTEEEEEEAKQQKKKKMTLRQQNQHASEFRLPADVDWHMLDKSKFFLLGAALFSGVSATLYPVVVLKTRQQVMKTTTTSSSSPPSCTSLGLNILRREGVRGLYKGLLPRSPAPSLPELCI